MTIIQIYEKNGTILTNISNNGKIQEYGSSSTKGVLNSIDIGKISNFRYASGTITFTYADVRVRIVNYDNIKNSDVFSTFNKKIEKKLTKRNKKIKDAKENVIKRKPLSENNNINEILSSINFKYVTNFSCKDDTIEFIYNNEKIKITNYSKVRLANIPRSFIESVDSLIEKNILNKNKLKTNKHRLINRYKSAKIAALGISCTILFTAIVGTIINKNNNINKDYISNSTTTSQSQSYELGQAVLADDTVRILSYDRQFAFAANG